MEQIKFKNTVINALITVIVTMLVQLFITYLDSYSAKVEIISVLNDNGIYNNVISVKSYKKSDYLNDIVLENNLFKDDNFKIKGSKAEIKDGSIIITKVSPNETISITFDSDEEITEDNLKIIYSDKKVLIEFLNNTSDVLSQTILSIFINSFVYFLLILLLTYFACKTINKDIVKINDELKEMSKTSQKLDKKVQSSERRAEELEREMYDQDLFYCATMEDVKKENEFYRSLLNKIIGKHEKVKIENIEQIVKKELGVFKKEEAKYNSYGVIRFLADRLNKKKDE